MRQGATAGLASRLNAVTIRDFTPHDLSAILKIQDENPAAARWAADDFARLMGGGRGFILVAESQGDPPSSVTGFAAYHSMAEDAELLNLAVAVEYQRRGVGGMLVREGVQRLREQGARRLWLEVRESNATARKFYIGLGFVERGRRRNYYSNPQEDALVLELKLEGENE